MAWRIVKQPNGKLARFSDVVDDFTAMDMTEAEAFNLCRVRLGIEDAKRKARAGLEDWKPWAVAVSDGKIALVLLKLCMAKKLPRNGA